MDSNLTAFSQPFKWVVPEGHAPGVTPSSSVTRRARRVGGRGVTLEHTYEVCLGAALRQRGLKSYALPVAVEEVTSSQRTISGEVPAVFEGAGGGMRGGGQGHGASGDDGRDAAGEGARVADVEQVAGAVVQFQKDSGRGEGEDRHSKPAATGVGDDHGGANRCRGEDDGAEGP
jgi:hypothetical protein